MPGADGICAGSVGALRHGLTQSELQALFSAREEEEPTPAVGLGAWGT